MRLRFARALAQSIVVAALAFVPASLLRAQVGEIDCQRPDTVEVRSLRFVGNSAFTSDQLSTYVLTTPSSFTHRYFGWFFGAGAKRCYPDVGLLPDATALKQLYVNNGFFDAKVDTLVTPVGPARVGVTFEISEGQPIVVDSFSVNGLEGVADTAKILRDLRIHVGGRFGLEPLFADIDTITRRLTNAGYPRATILKSYSVKREDRRAVVGLDVDTGPFSRFGTITIKSLSVNDGPPAIDTAVVRKLLGFRSHDEYSDAVLADAQRNLYNLGTYRQVGLFVDTAYQHGDSVDDIVVNLHEDYLHQYQEEEGWAILDCFRVNAGYTDKNFLDEAQRLELTGRLSKIGYGAPTAYSGLRDLCYRPYLNRDSIGSSKLNYYAGATLSRPTLFGTHWVPSYSLYTERRSEYEAFLRTTFLGLEASATRSLGQGLPFRAGYTIEYGQTIAQPAVLCALFVTCSAADQAEAQRRLRLAIASATIQRIRTDDPTEPSRGYVLGAEVRGGAPFIGSDPSLKFFKTTGQGSIYRKLHSRMIFAFHVGGGLITGGRLPPPQERLYAGGATSVRGFQQNELGPEAYLLDTTAFRIDTLGKDAKGDDSLAFIAKPGARSSRPIPLGGNSMFVFNAELRIRDPFFPDLLEYVPFIDGGQVWTQTASHSLNVERPAVTPGLGLRVFSPVGPIQVNIGYNPYQSRPGPAYFAAPVDPNSSQAPLICVTAPGAPMVIVHSTPSGLVQDNTSCPNFIPAQSSNFLKHLVFTLSIITGF